MSHRCATSLVCLALFLSALVLGCGQSPAPQKSSEVLTIPVSKPVQRQVSDYVDYNGQTVPINSVDIRARVTGYLNEVTFTEGAEVSKGDLLFVIDPRPYQSQVAQARAQLALNQANYRLAVAEYQRGRAISRDPNAISVEDLEKLAAAQDSNKASVDVAKANLEDAELLLSWTRVTSPIDGQISRFFFTVGNLISQDQTLLTTIVSLDPMYVTFEMDTPTLNRVIAAINAGKIERVPTLEKAPLFIGLEGEDGYPHEGHLNFVNNQVNPATGTLLVRGVFDNKPPVMKESQSRPESIAGIMGLLASPKVPAPLLAASQVLPARLGVRLLKPGLFVRVRLPIGQPHPALLVVDRAIGSDQGLRYVYVLDDQNRVQYRRVETGALQEDGLRVISKGIEANDRVVIGGLQQVQPKMVVKPEERAMPTFGEPENADEKQ
jgi:multidrug efflux system membrane fusion protein